LRQSLANFANFRNYGVFGFGGRVSECIPQDRVGVKVGVDVQHFAIAKGAFVECPTDEIDASVGDRSVARRLSDWNGRGGGSGLGWWWVDGFKRRWKSGLRSRRGLSSRISGEELSERSNTER
jgi:hypothetical protein